MCVCFTHKARVGTLHTHRGTDTRVGSVDRYIARNERKVKTMIWPCNTPNKSEPALWPTPLTRTQSYSHFRLYLHSRAAPAPPGLPPHPLSPKDDPGRPHPKDAVARHPLLRKVQSEHAISRSDFSAQDSAKVSMGGKNRTPPHTEWSGCGSRGDCSCSFVGHGCVYFVYVFVFEINFDALQHSCESLLARIPKKWIFGSRL